MSFGQDLLYKPETQVKAAWVTATISGAFTTVFAAAGMFVHGSLSTLVNPGLFLDSALTFILAFGIFRRSRVAAIAMFGYWVAGRVYLVYVHGAKLSITPLLVALIFGLGIHGTFVLHDAKKSGDSSDNSSPAI